MRRLIELLCILLPTTASMAAPPRGENLLKNPGFEQATAGTADHWHAIGPGYSFAPGRHASQQSIHLQGDQQQPVHGVIQELTFDPPIAHPFVVSGWSRSQAAEGLDFCLYVDVWYEDGTNLWGQRGDFRTGSHDWQYVEFLFDVAKPVSRIQYFILFRECTGEAWFDDVSLSLAPFRIVSERLQPGLYGGNSLDVCVKFSLPAQWQASVLREGREVFRTAGDGTTCLLSWGGTDKVGQLLPGGAYTLRMEAADHLLNQQLVCERPVSTPSGQGSGFVAWTESSMTRVLPTAVPMARPDSLQTRISLAGGEYESFQVALRTAPGVELRDCQVQMSDLSDGRGNVICTENLEWHQVGFVEFKELNPAALLPEDAAPGWWPDPLLSVNKFHVTPSFTQPLWFTVYAPRKTPAGVYKGQIQIRPSNADPIRVDVEAQLYGFDLPIQSHLKTAFALMDGFLEKLYGRPLSPALRRAYGDYLLRHRLNPDDISRTDPPDLDDLEHYNGRGLNAFNVLNLVQPRGEHTWVCWSPLEVYTPAFKQELIERLDPYVAGLKQRDFFSKAYIYTFDERGEDFWPIMREYFGLVKQRYAIPTLTTAYVPQDPDVMKDLQIDWNCPLTAAYNFDQAEACRREGLQVWAYTCCGPRKPYCNILGDDPLIESRLLWWQAFHQKFDGFLFWGLNIWDRQHNDYLIDPQQDGPRLRWSITTSPPGTGWTSALHGDGELLYPAKDGPLGCIRLANIRDGLEDYEYLWQLGELTGDVEVARQACRPVTENLTTFTLDPQVLAAQRDVIARRVEELQQP